MAGLMDISRTFSKHFNLTLNDGRTCVEFVFNAIKDQLAEGNSVFLKGIGVFKCKVTEARTIRNPRTGEPTNVDAGVRVMFSASDRFKDEIKLKKNMITQEAFDVKYKTKVNEAFSDEETGEEESEDEDGTEEEETEDEDEDSDSDEDQDEDSQ